jgi:hypothetical protein
MGWLENKELEKMWKEAVVASGTEENQKNLTQENLSLATIWTLDRPHMKQEEETIENWLHEESRGKIQLLGYNLLWNIVG